MDSVNLQENFKLFYRIAQILIVQLKDEDKVLAAQWMRKLASCRSAPDLELRNHYMSLLLIVLQQKCLVGPFRTIPGAGSKLEPFSQDYQLADIRKLIVEELAKNPPFPIPQYALSGGPLYTEFSVAQEIPKFGVEFLYVYTLQPIHDFQQAQQSRIPRALQGPSRSTMRDLNAGIESLLRSEKQKMKITIDEAGKRKIQIRDEHFADFSTGPRQPRMIPKKLQKRLGVKLPEPQAETDAFGEEPISTTSRARTGAVPKTKTIRQPTGLRPPGTAAPSGLRAPGRVRQTTIPKEESQRVIQQHRSPVRQTRSPLRIVRHPDAPPTPPIFVSGARTAGLIYEPQQFGIEPTEKFTYPKTKMLKMKWTPSRRIKRPQVRDIVKEHPITEQIRHLQPEPRPRIATPEIIEEIREQQRRAQLLEGADVRTRGLMEQYYAAKAAKPRVLDFSQHEEPTEIEIQTSTSPRRPGAGLVVSDRDYEEIFQPLLLDDSPIAPEDLLAEEELAYDDMFGEAAYVSPVRPRTPARDISYAAALTPRQQEVTRELSRSRSDLLKDESEFLADEDIDFADDYVEFASPRAGTPRTPISATRRIEEARRAYRETMGRSSPKTPVRTLPRPVLSTPKPAPYIYKSPEISPGGTTARLIDISPGTPQRMTSIMHRINRQVKAHNELIGNISEQPRTPSVENLAIEVKKGKQVLETLRGRLDRFREQQVVKPESPLQEKATEETEVPLSPLGIKLQLQNLSDVIQEAVENAQELQDVSETIQEPVVQQAAEQSLNVTDELLNISNRMNDVWEETAKRLGDSSLGLIGDDELGDDIFAGAQMGSPVKNALNRIVDTLNNSVEEIIAEGAIPGTPAFDQLEKTLNNFKRALQQIDFDESLLDTSLPAEDLLNETMEKLEQSLQSEAAAVAAVSKSPGKEQIVEKGEAIVEEMSEVLDDLVAIQPVLPTASVPLTPTRSAIASRLEMLRTTQKQTVEQIPQGIEPDELVDVEIPQYAPFTLDWPEEEEEVDEVEEEKLDESDKILDIDEMEMDDSLLVDQADEIPKEFFSAAVPQFEPEILEESFMNTDDIFGEEFVATPTKYTPTLLRTGYSPRSPKHPTPIGADTRDQLLDLVEETKQQQDRLLDASIAMIQNAEDTAAVAKGQQIAQQILKSQAVLDDIVTSVQIPGSPLREDERNFAWLGPMATQGRQKRHQQPQPAPSTRQIQRPQSTTSRIAPPKPTAIRRPVQTTSSLRPPSIAGGSQRVAPRGTQAPRPRAGSATPTPVTRPQTAQPHSSSVRRMLPRPSSAAPGPSRRR
ncbi:uncharacterized protein LOC129761871 [Toxorhynchites rutilus septentrionalis]|uniref:uncharacterized protein LOC129761871 n=1 Tax=Toxorhynchites rutilus septentrionalis TaxID=329112 RepID=UPI00247AF2AA|nr:uncharacterized protein LOC129761871 [Toxorhynchites rutilus septentrionalis]